MITNKKTSSLREILKDKQTLIVVGGNWGDEGKGKIIDAILSEYDTVARFSGGANAGHTVMTPEGVKVVSHLIPCGLAQNKECVMGRGEFVDLRLLTEEIEQVKGILKTQLPDIWVDEMSALWTPWHAILEGWLESSRGKGKVGTTGKGIGPLEGIFKLRISPVVGQILLPKEDFVEVLKLLYNALLPIFEKIKEQDPGLLIPTPDEVADSLMKFAPLLKDSITDTSYILGKSFKAGKKILFEGAQALGLDSRWGTYPYVSSGISAAAGAAIGTGLPVSAFSATMMVAKTLPTRVGRGPFPSEMWERDEAMNFAKQHTELFTDKAAAAVFLTEKLNLINSGKAEGKDYSQYFQVLGDERGATTGRGRSVGFLDIPWLLYAARINGPTWIALTRFDMLSKVKSIPVIVGYKYKGQVLPEGKLPPPWELSKIEPVFEHWPCWEEDIMGINSESSLPQAARDFLARLEKHLGVPILLVGTGPGRQDLVIRN